MASGCSTSPAGLGATTFPGAAARNIAALLALREQVIAPILAGVRSPRMGRKTHDLDPVDRDYEQLCIDMQALFADLNITAAA